MKPVVFLNSRSSHYPFTTISTISSVVFFILASQAGVLQVFIVLNRSQIANFKNKLLHLHHSLTAKCFAAEASYTEIHQIEIYYIKN